MSYIGRNIDSINNISTLDNLSFNGSDATFNLTQNSVAFVPVSADALQIQIDGVIQSGNYTISGSTVTFDFTPSGSSVCNGIRHYGVGLLTTVSDGAVTNVKLGADSVNGSKIADDSISDEHLDITAITGQTAITSLADTDKFLVSDASDSGNLKYVENQYLGGGGLVPVKQSSGSSNTANVVVNGWISDTYENYVMDYYFNVATNNEAISMTLYDASGNISSGNEYNWTHIGSQANDGAKVELYNSSQNAFRLCHGANNDSARVSVTGRLTWLHPRASGKRTTILHHQRQLNNSANVQSFIGALEFKATNALTGFYCNSTSGDISGWDIKIYGIKDS